jgi:hypothetical protein
MVPTTHSANVPRPADRSAATLRGALATVGLLAGLLVALLSPSRAAVALLVVAGTLTAAHLASRPVRDRSERRDHGPAPPRSDAAPGGST